MSLPRRAKVEPSHWSRRGISSGSTYPDRTLDLAVSEEELARRRRQIEARGQKAYRPRQRHRPISQALAAYAALTTSAAQGAVRDISQLG